MPRRGVRISGAGPATAAAGGEGVIERLARPVGGGLPSGLSMDCVRHRAESGRETAFISDRARRTLAPYRTWSVPVREKASGLHRPRDSAESPAVAPNAMGADAVRYSSVISPARPADGPWTTPTLNAHTSAHQPGGQSFIPLMGHIRTTSERRPAARSGPQRPTDLHRRSAEPLAQDAKAGDTVRCHRL